MTLYRKSVGGLPMQLFMTVLWVMVAWGPIWNDFNDTHLFNPDWSPHARFHMMMVFSDAVALALFGLYLVWGKTSSRLERLRLSAVAGFLYVLGVTIAAFTMPMYGGSMHWDDTTPRAATLADGNYLVFLITAAIFLLLLVLLYSVRKSGGDAH